MEEKLKADMANLSKVQNSWDQLSEVFDINKTINRSKIPADLLWLIKQEKKWQNLDF